MKDLFFRLKRFINYSIVGALTTTITLVIYYLLVYTCLNPNNAFELQLANILSWFAGVAFSYSANRNFVFKSTEPNKLKEGAKFVGSRCITLIMDMLIMAIRCNFT